jgi:hypothetical protein
LLSSGLALQQLFKNRDQAILQLVDPLQQPRLQLGQGLLATSASATTP